MLLLFALRTKYNVYARILYKKTGRNEKHLGPVLKNRIFAGVFNIEMGAKRAAVHAGNAAAWTHIDSISCFVRVTLHCSIHWAARAGDKAPLDQLRDDPPV